MHKKPGAGKKTGARIDPSGAPGAVPDRAAPGQPGRARRARQAPHSVNELLARRSGLRQVVREMPAQQAWGEWLRERLPAELAAHLLNAVPKGSVGAPRELLLLVDSAAWCARLRYGLGALEREIRSRDATIARISVRVGR